MGDPENAWIAVVVVSGIAVILGVVCVSLSKINSIRTSQAKTAIKIADEAIAMKYRCLHHAVHIGSMLAEVLDTLPKDAYPDMRIELRNRLNQILPPGVTVRTEAAEVDRSVDLDAGEVPVCAPSPAERPPPPFH